MRKKYVINDLLLFFIIGIIIFVLIRGLSNSYNYGYSNNKIILDYHSLAFYSLHSTLRILIGLFLSFIVTFILGTLAAKYKSFERVILPIVNIMESIPLVGFLTFSTVFFIALFPHSIIGLELSAIFGVFTGQVWNMILIFYQTLKIIPNDIIDASKIFYHNSWQRFWKIECPFSMPGLLWNIMVSQSSAWFAILATEAIPVKNKTIELSGVGSFMAEALLQANVSAVIYSIIAVILNIILLDQVLFKPLVCWISKFKYEDAVSQYKSNSLFYNIIVNSYSHKLIKYLWDWIVNFIVYYLPNKIKKLAIFDLKFNNVTKLIIEYLWYIIVFLVIIYYGFKLWAILPKIDLIKMPMLMLISGIRVFIAIFLSILIFLPLGVLIGLNPKALSFFQPIIQILAALPVNLLYPLVAIFLITSKQSLGIVSIFLIMLGTQWYILFNVIAGASSIPSNLLEVSRLFNVKGIMWWKKFIIPAIFPYMITGIIAAAGGAWNAVVVSELIVWGNHVNETIGLGSYIQSHSSNNGLAEAALGCTVMSVMVGFCIVFIWNPLYKIAETRFKLD